MLHRWRRRLALYVLLRAFPVTISETELDFDTVAEKAALGFIAGFSEPVLLKTVERVTNLIVKEPTPKNRPSREDGNVSGGAGQRPARRIAGA